MNEYAEVHILNLKNLSKSSRESLKSAFGLTVHPTRDSLAVNAEIPAGIYIINKNPRKSAFAHAIDTINAESMHVAIYELVLNDLKKSEYGNEVLAWFSSNVSAGIDKIGVHGRFSLKNQNIKKVRIIGGIYIIGNLRKKEKRKN